jgi:hypothetical protein
MSEVAIGVGLATAAAGVGAIAACVKGLSQKYTGSAKTFMWLFGFSIGMLEAVFDSWALQVVSANINLSCKGFGVLFSAIFGWMFAGEVPQAKQYVASFFLVGGPLLIAYASLPQSIEGIPCPIEASPTEAIRAADVVTKSVYFLAFALLAAGYLFKAGNTGGVGDYRVLGWILWASILHTLQANRVHEFQWDPLTDMVIIDTESLDKAVLSFASPERLQVSAGVLLATVLFQISETLAFSNAGVIGPVHAAYIGTLILDALLHDLGGGQFIAYTCTQYWVLGIGAGACLLGAVIAAGIKHGDHDDGHAGDPSKGGKGASKGKKGKGKKAD